MGLKFKFIVCFIITACLYVTLYTYFLDRNTIFSELHHQSTDVFLRYRYEHAPKPEYLNKIIIIDPDEETLQKLRERWPINRGFFALLLKNIDLAQNRPKVVGFDLSFIGASEREQADLFFADMLKRSGNVILVSYFDSQGLLMLPERRFSEAALNTGFVNLPRDSDIIERRFYPYSKLEDDHLYYQFCLQVYSAFKQIDLNSMRIDKNKQVLNLPYSAMTKEKISFPIDLRSNTVGINYLAKARDFKVIPLWQVLSSLQPWDVFKDKIVLIGSMTEIEHDIYPTPLGIMPGVVINANIILSLLSNRPLQEIPPMVNFCLMLITALVVCFTVYLTGNLKGFIVGISAIVWAFYLSVMSINKDMVFDFSGIVLIVIISYVLTIIFKYILIVVERNHLHELAMTDGLTGLYAYRYFEFKLNMEIKIAKDAKSSLSLIIFDIDNFKKFNDHYGHEAGNEMLKRVASLISGNSRSEDTVARYGGEEFVIILPNIELLNAVKYADKIRKVIEDSDLFWQDKLLKTTVSVGVSSLVNLNKSTSQGLIVKADKALYMAKSSGKNKVCY